MIGLVINDGYAIAVVPVALVSTIGLVAYIVRELGRVAVVLGRVDERLDAQDQRLDRLETKI